MIVEYEVEADPSVGMRGLRAADYDRERTINVKFVPDRDEFLVLAWGRPFAVRNSGGYSGRLRRSANDLQAAISDLRQRWRKEVLELRVDGPRRSYPYVDEWDLSAGEPANSRKMWLELARIGAVLFDTLFPQNEDDGLAEISRILEQALLVDDQVIRFDSDEILAPWSMLYIGGKSADALRGPRPKYELDHFIGLRHLVEHSVSVARGTGDYRLLDSRILLRTERPVVGLNVDGSVDRMPPATECVTKIIAFFGARAEIVVRRDKDSLAEALRDPALADTIHFYGCHGAVSKDSDGTDRPYLKLEDQELIFNAEFRNWLSGHQFRSGPVVFMSSCEGGQLSALHYTPFGRHLLDAGARCLVGPQIDLPRRFAAEFVKRVFESFLVPSTPLGDVIRDVARDFAFHHGNPLGLIFSLYRGLDVHLHAMPA